MRDHAGGIAVDHRCGDLSSSFFMPAQAPIAILVCVRQTSEVSESNQVPCVI
ncbi:hypothetical protein PROFUN_10827 [Planoprotostelium fungivorum]|uniref:Uncharacterized protein n=1 Tax=Planoprotostelium fungivorum TaxID=1890364 RepID=A0A2P6NCP8_9EUKA|nr:hypothetical protein PROFUN_10827 [Planoprotostelium fungivorum]